MNNNKNSMRVFKVIDSSDKENNISDFKYYSIAEVAEILRMEEGTIRNRRWRGDAMPLSVRVGRRRLFPSREFHEWLYENRI